MATTRATVTVDPAEWAALQADPLYFIDQYCQVYDGALRSWIPFRLWDSQVPVLDLIERDKLLVLLKARQLGQSQLALSYALWLMMFWPAATVLVFSKREEEAAYLLGEERLRGMHRRLPEWLRLACPFNPQKDGATLRMMANGSVIRAFPSNAGDSYTASLAIVDEADLVPDLETLLGKVQPTIDAGGKLILLSRANKAAANSTFKRIYREARAGTTNWRAHFLPWHAHPARTREWYEAQKADIQARTGSLDQLHEHYPETPEEALSPPVQGKRIPPPWLQRCFVEMPRVELSRLRVLIK